jgi:hypothetical protein
MEHGASWAPRLDATGLSNPTRATRLAVYFRKMFPLGKRIPLNLANFLVIYFGLQAVGGQAPLRLTWRALAGAITVQLLMLLIRVYDELKDFDSDIAHARAGDDRFKDRPHVTGEVKIEDIAALRWWATIAVVALNLPLGWPLPFLAFVLAFGYIWLSFKWFFWPAVSKNLILVFITHMPNILVVELYVLTVYVKDFGPAGLNVYSALLVIAIFCQFAAWETSYKVRLPESETTFQTYSMMLGWRTAALVPAVFLFVAAGCTVIVARAAGLGWWFPAVAIVAAMVGILACIRFRLWPTAARAKLQPYSELYWLTACFGLSLALILRHSITVGG